MLQAPSREPITIDPRVSQRFAAKGHESYAWLELTFPVDAEPSALLADLAAIGWTEDNPAFRLPYPAYTNSEPSTRLDYDELSVHVTGPAGSGLFGTWSPTEKRGHMLSARRVLRSYGLTNLTIWHKTLAEMV